MVDTVGSRIERVVVHPGAAMVRRTAEVVIAGPGEIAVRGLPYGLVDDSVQVTVTGPGRAVSARVAIETVALAAASTVDDEVAAASSAVAAVTAERFDAVLMDLEMPELDGAEATRRIRAAEHAIGNLRVPIIALSAHARAELTAAAAGMDAYLAKPLDVGALGLLLEQVIEHGLRAPIDHTARLAKVGGRAELARTIIATFLSHQPTLTEGIDAALAAQEREDLHRAAHGLRGALLMVGACEAAAIADLLERADPATAAPLRQRLAIEIARAGAELALAQ